MLILCLEFYSSVVSYTIETFLSLIVIGFYSIIRFYLCK